MANNKNENLIKARKKKGFTQGELAKLVNASSKATISNWENGYSKPRLEVALVLSEVLEVDVFILFGY